MSAVFRFIEGDFDAYVKNIQQPYVWGGEPELLMASHVLKWVSLHFPYHHILIISISSDFIDALCDSNCQVILCIMLTQPLYSSGHPYGFSW